MLYRAIKSVKSIAKLAALSLLLCALIVVGLSAETTKPSDTQTETSVSGVVDATGDIELVAGKKKPVVVTGLGQPREGYPFFTVRFYKNARARTTVYLRQIGTDRVWHTVVAKGARSGKLRVRAPRELTHWEASALRHGVDFQNHPFDWVSSRRF